MPNKIALLLLATLLSLSCNTITRLNAPPRATPSPSESEAEYAVYKAVMENMFQVDSLATVVVRDQTSPGMDLVGNDPKEFEYIQKSLPEVDQAMKEDFLARNAKAVPLEDRFNLNIPVTLLNQKAFDSFFGQNGQGWKAYYLAYPKSQGVLTLSRVGFNARGDKALVYAGNMAFALAGAGYAIVLGQENGQWRVLNQVMLWIS